MSHRWSVVVVCAVLACAAAAAVGEPPAMPDSSAVPRDQWDQLPKVNWGKVILSERLELDGGRYATGVHAIRFRAPTGQAVVMSPVFRMDGVDPVDPKGAIRSWTASPLASPTTRLELGSLLIPAELARQVECMLMAVNEPMGRSAGLLTAATAPRPYHVWGYMVVPDEAAADGFTIYRASILGPDSHNRPGIFCVGIFTKVDPKTVQCGAVLDADGHLLGMQIGYYPESVNGSAVTCNVVDLPTLLAAAKLPTLAPPPNSDRPAATAAAAAAAAAKPAATRPAVADPSATALEVARIYERAALWPKARERLQHVIDAYPNTPAADQARTELHAIEHK